MEVAHFASSRTRHKPSPASYPCLSQSPNTLAAGHKLAGGEPIPVPATHTCTPIPRGASRPLPLRAFRKECSQHAVPLLLQQVRACYLDMEGGAAGSRGRIGQEWVGTTHLVARQPQASGKPAGGAQLKALCWGRYGEEVRQGLGGADHPLNPSEDQKPAVWCQAYQTTVPQINVQSNFISL